MNPWLQRFLISVAAGTVMSAGQVATAKRPHRLKKRSKKKQTKEPVQMGQQALKDAKAAADPGLSVEEWTDGIKALPSRVASVFKRVPKPDESGAREPDEVQTKDGVTTTKKKRRKGKRKQATLWDSAKESMRQTVKEVVKEEVKDTPVGAAAEAAKNAKDVAKSVGEKAKEVGATVVENAGPAAQKVKEGAIKAADNAKTWFNKLVDKMDQNPPQSLLHSDDESPQHGPEGEEGAPAGEPHVEEAQASPGGVEAPQEPAAEDGKPAVDVAEVGKKISEGINNIGTWLQGPGAPQSKRVKPSSSNGEPPVDVVEAKDADPKDPIN